MILDGYWKLELNRYVRRLLFWGSQCKGTGTYAEHQFNKNILYSAAIIRKLIEDESDAKKRFEQSSMTVPNLALLHYDLPVLEYIFEGDKEYIPHTVLTDYYSGEKKWVTVEAKTICHSIIHSYVWNLAYDNKHKGLIGFLTASDYEKEKKLYFVKLSDWIDYIKYCKENSTV